MSTQPFVYTDEDGHDVTTSISRLRQQFRLNCGQHLITMSNSVSDFVTTNPTLSDKTMQGLQNMRTEFKLKVDKISTMETEAAARDKKEAIKLQAMRKKSKLKGRELKTVNDALLEIRDQKGLTEEQKYRRFIQRTHLTDDKPFGNEFVQKRNENEQNHSKNEQHSSVVSKKSPGKPQLSPIPNNASEMNEKKVESVDDEKAKESMDKREVIRHTVSPIKEETLSITVEESPILKKPKLKKSKSHKENVGPPTVEETERIRLKRRASLEKSRALLKEHKPTKSKKKRRSCNRGDMVDFSLLGLPGQL